MASLRDNPFSNFLFGEPSKQQPGVGGQADDPTRLVRDPVSGMYYDPKTGTSYTDELGGNPVTNPNVAQQVAANYARQQAFLEQLNPLEAERQHAVAGQNDLAGFLRGTVHGTQPSVVGLQLGQGMNKIAGDQMSMASGVSGAAAPLAGMMAARNIGSAQVGMNQNAAIARVQEQQAAANALAQLLNQQATGAQGAFNSRAGLATTYGGMAEGGQEAQQGLNRQADKERADQESKLGFAFLKGAGEAFGL